MIVHLRGRENALELFGWTGRRAEWIALACLHGGVFTRAQWTRFLGCHTEKVRRPVHALIAQGVATEENVSGITGIGRVCRVYGRDIYRALGAEDSRRRRITSLEEAQAASRLGHRLKTLTHPALLVVDEIGYLPITRNGAMLFFQLMARRYETASTVLTSNKPFDEWGEIFGDDLMAGALIDRLLHHCHIVNIRGNSYRMRHHQDLWRSLSSPTAEEESSQPKRTRRRREAATI